MFVLFVTWNYPYRGSIAYSFVRDQAIAIANAGNKVVVAHVMPRNPLKLPKIGLDIETENRIRIYHLFCPSIPLAKRMTVALMSTLLTRLYERIERDCGRPDILHAHFGEIAGSASLNLKKATGIPLVITEHSSRIESLVGGSWSWKNECKALHGADQVIAVSSKLAGVLKPFREDVDVIPNMIDGEQFDSAHSAHQGYVFVSLANLKPGKGFDVLIRAFCQAFANDSDVRLIIGGEGGERRRIEALICELGLASRISLAGTITRNAISSFLHQGDAFVLASRYETFGIVLIEAMACGLPIVATKCGGPQEIINGENGILVGVNDVSGLATAMKAMKERSLSFSSSDIRSRCLCAYDAKNVSRRIIEVYGKAIKKAGK